MRRAGVGSVVKQCQLEQWVGRPDRGGRAHRSGAIQSRALGPALTDGDSTGATIPISIRANVGILRGVRVPLSACGAEGVGDASLMQRKMFGLGHRDKMIEIHARTNPAAMVEIVPVRDTPARSLVDCDVNEHRDAASPAIDSAITRLGDMPLPKMARRLEATIFDRVVPPVDPATGTRGVIEGVSVMSGHKTAGAPASDRRCLTAATQAQARRVRVKGRRLSWHRICPPVQDEEGVVTGGVASVCRSFRCSQLYQGSDGFVFEEDAP